MSRIPGLNYAQPNPNSKGEGRQSRSCVVLEADASRCVVTFQLKGVQQRAVLPLSRLFSEHGACADSRPPVVGEKMNCDMTPADYRTLNAQWLVQFAWRGKMDSSNKASQSLLQDVTAMVTELSEDSGVAQFVVSGGGRERCAFSRAAIQTGGAPLPPTEPLTRCLQVTQVIVCDCQRSTVVTGCRYVADKVWTAASSSEPEEFSDDEEDEGEDLYPSRPAGDGGFIYRMTLKNILGRVVLVTNYKAVLAFEHGGQHCRALLLTAKYSFSEKMTAQERRDLTRVLANGDTVIFTCHEYDKPEGSDRCGWWVMEAVKQEPTAPPVGREAGYFNQGLLYEKIGQVSEVFMKEGLLRFVLDTRRQVAWFSVSEVYIDGRLCVQRLPDVLEIGMRVHFNAERARDGPCGADWRCTCVWRGDQPTVEASRERMKQVVTKKTKKKSGRGTMNALDDFEVPDLPQIGASAVYREPLTHVVNAPEVQMAGGDVPRAKPSRRARMHALDDFNELGAAGGGDLGWSGDGWDHAAAGDSAGEGCAVRSLVEELLVPGESRRSDWPTLVSPPHQDASPRLDSGSEEQSESEPSSSENELSPVPAETAPSRQAERPSLTPAALAAAAAASYREQSAANHKSNSKPGAMNNQRQTAAEPPVAPPVQTPSVPGSTASAQPMSQAVAAARSRPPGLAEPPSVVANPGAAELQQRHVAALNSLLGGQLQQPPPLIANPPALMPSVPYSHYLSGPPDLVPPAQQWMGMYRAGIPSQPAAAGQQLQQLQQQRLEQDRLIQQRLEQERLKQQRLEQERLNQQRLEQNRVNEQRLQQERLSQQHLEQGRLNQQRLEQERVSQQRVEPERLSQQRVELQWLSQQRQQLGQTAPGGCDSAPTQRRQQPSGSSSGSSRPASSPSPSPSPLDAGRETALVHQTEAMVLNEQLHRTTTNRTPAQQVADTKPVPGTGVILAFVDDERGLAEWERDGRSEQVMFERHNCFWLGAPMDALDLTDCYSAGERVSFMCVPAPPNQPYQWVASELHQLED